ncbi:MAG: hypothetical protein WCK28_10855, partial [Burkholderiales bacterium]
SGAGGNNRALAWDSIWDAWEAEAARQPSAAAHHGLHQQRGRPALQAGGARGSSFPAPAAPTGGPAHLFASTSSSSAGGASAAIAQQRQQQQVIDQLRLETERWYKMMQDEAAALKETNSKQSAELERTRAALKG